MTHDALDHVLREPTIKGIIGYRKIFPEVIALINSGRLPVEKLITNVISLDEIIIKGFESLLKDPLEVKILINLKK